MCYYSLKQLRCLFFNNRDDATECVLRTLFRRFTSRIWRSQMNRRAVASSRLLKTIGRSPIQNGLNLEPIDPVSYTADEKKGATALRLKQPINPAKQQSLIRLLRRRTEKRKIDQFNPPGISCLKHFQRFLNDPWLKH